MNNLREAMSRVDADMDAALKDDPDFPPQLVGLNPDEVREMYLKAAEQSADICNRIEAEIKRLSAELAKTRAVNVAHLASIKSLDSFGKPPIADMPGIKTKHTGINHDEND